MFTEEQENETTFNQKFEAQRLQIEEVKTVVRRESDRIIEAVLAGPHEKIVDKASEFQEQIMSRH